MIDAEFARLRLRLLEGRTMSYWQPRFRAWLFYLPSRYRAWRTRNPSIIILLVQVTTIGFSTVYIGLNLPSIIRLIFPSPNCELVDHLVTQGDRVACVGEYLELLHEFRLLKRDGEPLTIPFIVREPSRVVLMVPKAVPPGEYFLELRTSQGRLIRQTEKIKVMSQQSLGFGLTDSNLPPAAQSELIPPWERDRLITFANLNWDSAQLQTAIARFIVMHGYGYPTQVIPSGRAVGNARDLWNGLCGGSIDVLMEVWLPNLQTEWNEALSRAQVIPLGKSMDHVWQSAFVVPTYIVEGDPARGIKALAPHLKTVEDLRKYKDVFATSSSQGKAVLVNCPATWSCKQTTEALVDAYDMDDVVVLQSSFSATAHFASLREAYAKGKPWLGYLWGSGIIPAGDLNLTILKEPFRTAECLTTGLGCGYSISQVFLVVHPALPIRAPGVYEFLRKWYFNTDTLNAAADYLAQENRNVEQAALMYLQDQEAVWTQWVPNSVAMRVKQGLQSVKP